MFKLILIVVGVHNGPMATPPFLIGEFATKNECIAATKDSYATSSFLLQDGYGKIDGLPNAGNTIQFKASLICIRAK